MTKITQAMREAIRYRAIEAKFAPIREAQAQAEAALAIEAYEFAYTAEERAAAEAMPKGWIRRDECLNYIVDGIRVQLTAAQALLVPYRTKDGHSGYSCHPNHATIVDSDLSRRIVAHAHATEDVRNEQRRVARQLDIMLKGYTSLKRLAADWPEGRPFFEKYFEAKPENLPAPLVADINAALGLQLEAAE